jgi:NTP pyrophosphatase (non-canonical NTP hydrolase)
MSAINHIDEESMVAFYVSGTMDSYQTAAGQFATYPGAGSPFGLWYCITKLAGEAGEAAEKMGKAFRDDALIELLDPHVETGQPTAILINDLTDEKRQALTLELGDVLWYVAKAAFELDLSLSDIATANLQKLRSRAERGKLQGSGDNR